MENQNNSEAEIKETQQNANQPEAETADTPTQQTVPAKPKNRKKWLVIGGAGLLAVIAVIAILFLTHVLCIHKWSAATCTQPEICSICDRTQNKPLGHENDPATCTEDAVCSVCGETVEKAFGHDWLNATCTEPETCAVCGDISGDALGHDWLDATCTTPITCNVCSETRGTGRHHWEQATCTKPKTCTGCGETEGKKLGHDWKDATCTEPQTCDGCGKTKGEAAGHDWMDATFTEPKTCKVCDETEGEPDYIGNYSPYEIMAMSLTESEFIEAAENAYRSEQLCHACPFTISTSTFPGCKFYFTEPLRHFHIYSGSISASTYVGMSYSSLVNALGLPDEWEINESDGKCYAVYYLSGGEINYEFNTTDNLYRQIQELKWATNHSKKITSSDLHISDTSMTVYRASIYG